MGFLKQLRILKFAFHGWFQPNSSPDNVTTFSYHRESQWTRLVTILLPLVILETAALHLLLHRWSPLAAGFSTFLSILTILWILADLQMVKKFLVRIEEKHLKVQVGARWEFSIPLLDILEVKLGVPDEFNRPLNISMGQFVSKPKLKGYENISLSGKANLHLVFNKPRPVPWIFGKPKTLDKIGLEIDDREAFVKALRNRLSEVR